jgi:hypothetical protein
MTRVENPPLPAPRNPEETSRAFIPSSYLRNLWNLSALVLVDLWMMVFF